ncbi:MAG: tetratricopeptide repeat protein [Muribaculaceae bacterium]|nr:tetratricopeptide repeat protein [Muribaculaceae bacterium]
MIKIPHIRTLERAVATAVLVTLMWACGVDKQRVYDELWTMSRQNLAVMDSAVTAPLLHEIDSLERLGARVPDTVAINAALQVSEKLFYTACDYGRTINYSLMASKLLGQIIEHEEYMRSNIIGLNAFAYASFDAMGLNDRAAQSYLRELSVAKSLNLKKSLAFIYNNLGSIYVNMGNSSEAISALGEAIKLNIELGDSSSLVFNYNNLGAAYVIDKQYDKAIEYSFLSQHYVEPSDSLMHMLIARSISNRYTSMGEYSLALRQLQPALAFFERTHATRELPFTYEKLAYLQWQLGDYDTAAASYERAFAMRSYASPTQRLDITKGYAEFCDSMGMRDREVQLLKYGQLLSDSLGTKSDGGLNASLSHLYQEEADKSDTQARLYKQSRTRMLWWIGTLATALALALGAWGWAMVRARRKAKDRLKEQEQLRQQLMTSSMDAERNAALLSATAKELQALQRTLRTGTPTEGLAQLKKITAQVMQADEGDDNDALTVANADFYRRVLARYPMLTQGDLRLCALLRQGLSTKEISAITCKEVRSVETARNRLRKKCGIPAGEDLCRHFLSI